MFITPLIISIREGKLIALVRVIFIMVVRGSRRDRTKIMAKACPNYRGLLLRSRSK